MYLSPLLSAHANRPFKSVVAVDVAEDVIVDDPVALIVVDAVLLGEDVSVKVLLIEVDAEDVTEELCDRDAVVVPVLLKELVALVESLVVAVDVPELV